MRYRLLLTVAVCSVLMMGAGCTSQLGGDIFHPQPWRTASTYNPSDATLRAFIRAHPVPHIHGMTDGIVSEGDYLQTWTNSCHTGRGSRGDGGCTSWRETLVTATGTLTIQCGGRHTICTSITYPASGNPNSTEPATDDDFPIGGDWLYVPTGGQVSATHDVRIIRRFTLTPCQYPSDRCVPR